MNKKAYIKKSYVSIGKNGAVLCVRVPNSVANNMRNTKYYSISYSTNEIIISTDVTKHLVIQGLVKSKNGLYLTIKKSLHHLFKYKDKYRWEELPDGIKFTRIPDQNP